MLTCARTGGRDLRWPNDKCAGCMTKCWGREKNHVHGGGGGGGDDNIGSQGYSPGRIGTVQRFSLEFYFKQVTFYFFVTRKVEETSI